LEYAPAMPVSRESPFTVYTIIENVLAASS
jgi:hypothetical protein